MKTNRQDRVRVLCAAIDRASDVYNRRGAWAPVRTRRLITAMLRTDGLNAVSAIPYHGIDR